MKKALIFNLLSLVLVFFLAFSPALVAQYASYGSGIGVNILRGDDVSSINTSNARSTQEGQKMIGQPSLSLNIDYNFPREIASKWLKRLYNPIFANPYLQLRGQVIFNQFNISAEKNNSIATLGTSFLYFPAAIDERKNTNFFLETGYKLGWNNTIVDPFHAVVLGLGTRHRLGNDWYWQTNLSYTFAFYDYLDLSGPKGYAKTSQDGFFLLNFSLLKPFLTNREQKRVDQSRDSLAVAENFASSASSKSAKTLELIKGLQAQVKTIEDRILVSEKSAAKYSEMADTIIAKVAQGYARLKNKNAHYAVEREMDSLQSIGFSINLAHSVDFEKVNFELLSKNPIDQKINEVQQEINDARQNLLFANKFLPRSKDFKFKIDQLEARDLGQAREAVNKALRETGLMQGRIDRNKVKIKTLLTACEKADTHIKNAVQELERINLVIDKMKK